MAAPTPLAAAQATAPLSTAQCLKKLLLCAVYVSVSTLLIRFNKLMMQEGRFPFAMALSAIHMFVSSALCGLLYLAAPHMFPAMEATKGQRCDLMKMFVPIGLFFAVMLVGSNQAYAYCSVALLQFMKEANVMIVFLISCAVGLQSMSRTRVALILWVIVGATISVSGDLKFSLVGVAFQAVSQLAECARMVLGEFVLCGRKLDPLTYTSFIAPICLAVLLVASLAHWDPLIGPAFVKCWPLLLVNALVAFVLNVLVATVIKEISAVGFVLAGLTKDIVIVVLSSLIFHETLTFTQWAAFAMTLGGVGLWSMMKVSPDALPVQLLERALCMPPREVKKVEEKTPLFAKNA
uniref:Sugar phosphate transporter domain-containing protein n=1 Tax=Alexandrium catenella TaxID=2925 RepID=A0A7S1M652_ALECA